MAGVALAGLMAIPAAGQQPDVRCDIDGDGHADVAVAVPREGVGGADQAGAVRVFYGSDSALQPTGDDLWHVAPGDARPRRSGDDVPMSSEHLR